MARRPPAETLPAGAVPGAPAEALLRRRRVVPVDLAPVELRERRRNSDLALPVAPASLEQEHARARVLRQSGGENAAGRARADDRVVVHRPSVNERAAACKPLATLSAWRRIGSRIHTATCA